MNYIYLFACCVPVKGYGQSIIADLQRRTYQIIPNSLLNILSNLNKENCLEIIMETFSSEEDKEIFSSYIDFLLENEFIFIDSSKNDMLTNIDLNEFDVPFLVSNSIIDFDYTYDITSFDKIISELDCFRCESVELRFFNIKSLDDLNTILEKFNDTGIRSLSIVLPYFDAMNKELFDLLSNKQPRIRELSVYNCLDENKEFLTCSSYPVYQLDEKYLDEKKCGFISEKLFYVNIQNFTESLKHNSCLNRKISIDKLGNIKNCPSMLKSFGNIEESTLKEALNHSEFKKYWNITKDNVNTCKDCEFRYICTDCRAYTEDPGDHYSKPLKCGYSPYTNIWEDWSKNPLKKDAIKFYNF